MNIHENRLRSYTEESTIYGLDAEQSVIGHCVWKPDCIDDLKARVEASEFRHPLHQRVVAHLFALREEGKHPSLASLREFCGDDEVEPNYTAEDYITDVAKHDRLAFQLPFIDALETLVDQIAKRKLHNIGSDLASKAAMGILTPTQISRQSVEEIDAVMQSIRTSRKRSYDALGAADIALDHLENTSRKYPTTGLSDVDKLLGGWPRGQLSVVAGRPGAGKSAFAAMSLLQAAKAGHASLFFSLEMTGEQLGSRMLCDLSYTTPNPIYYEDILHQRIEEPYRINRLREAREKLSGLPIKIDEERGLTVSDIVARTRKAAMEFRENGTPLEVVFVDHMLLVKASSRYAGNRTREVAEISGALADLASELDISMVALCQLNRGVEGRDDKRPQLSDLRDSGAIEEDASAVVFLYRPAYYLEQKHFDDFELEQARRQTLSMCQHDLDVIAAKNRNGRTGIQTVFCDIGANAIRNKAYGAMR